MDFDTLNELIITVIASIGSIAFFAWMIARIIANFKAIHVGAVTAILAILLNIIFVIICINIYHIVLGSLDSWINAYVRYDDDAVLGLLVMIDIVVWIIVKFIEAYDGHNLYKKLDDHNPNNIEKGIEYMISNISDFEENERKMYKNVLYDIFRINLLSLQRQKRLIRKDFVKSFLSSLVFFIVGLIIPKLFVFIVTMIQNLRLD